MSLLLAPRVTVDSTRCRDCHRYVWMLRHEGTGKWAPIEQMPYEDGNVVVSGDTYRVLTKQELAQTARVQRFKSHFANCPSGPRFRRGRW